MRRTFSEPKTLIKKQTVKPLSERQAWHIVKLQKSLQAFLKKRSYKNMKLAMNPLKRDSRGKFLKRS